MDRIYLASAQLYDEEMRTKAAQHRTDRGPDWRTIEEPLNASEVIFSASDGEILLFDCATMWLTNHLLAENDLIAESARLMEALRETRARVVVVSNEVGLGIVPENALARRFRIEQGALNAQLAGAADCVVGVMAGLPFVLKGAMPEALG
ncbi:bifunctional adenosylcobinamide kinase/adenosylcobinamide-phosphate guanylyltransferase [Celeribacter arenosi]|uniref:Adenosylcobinamide kinase n=1 Tax=Celeribacter arenosi TaxID=792649 RepID=A0ABP7K2I6_9RHOB